MLKLQFLLALLFISPLLQAQESISLGINNGLETSYLLQFLGTDEKKNASKNKDEYQLTVLVTNTTSDTLYSTAGNLGGVRIANAESMTKTARANPVASLFRTTSNEALYQFFPGETQQNSVKVKVPQGEKPVVTYEAPSQLFQPINNFEIQVNRAVVVGTWKLEHDSRTTYLGFDETTNTIRQQGPNGSLNYWYKIAPRTFQRRAIPQAPAVVPEGQNPAPANQQLYTATLVFVTPNRILYTNTEGITVVFVKQ